MSGETLLDELVASVLASPRYRAISADLVRRIGARELQAHGKLKAAVKATRSKLHQVSGAYHERRQYARWLDELAVAAGEPAALQAACRMIMAEHASARERLGIVERFYSEIFAHCPPVGSLLDLACGLNPLALPWMPATLTRYDACDLDAELAAFIGAFLKLAGIDGQAFQHDLLGGPPPLQADMALILKTVPVLDQLQRDAGRNLLRAVQARRLVVSYPTRSLGGRKDFTRHYEEHFMQIAEGEGWSYQRLDFPGELVFIVEKPG